MDDLFDALKKAIYDYMNAEDLPIRTSQKIKGAYSKYAYDYNTVDSLLSVEEPEMEEMETEEDNEQK
jgi:hypothetical protein